MQRWTTALALCNWAKGRGSKKCNMAFCVVMCMLLLCARDVECCPGPTQTRLTSFEAKSMQGASGGSDPPQRRRPRPTEEVLEDILETFEGIDRRLTGIDSRLNKMDERMDRMDDKLDSTIAKTNEISSEQMELRSENQELKTQETDLESKVVYLEGPSKRNNLMFHGIPESRDETWDDCEKAVRKILDRNLEMPNASADSEVPIERAHRVGKYSRDKTRPIVVKFLTYKHKRLS